MKKCMHAENKGSIYLSGHTKKFLKLIFTVFLLDEIVREKAGKLACCTLKKST